MCTCLIVQMGKGDWGGGHYRVNQYLHWYYLIHWLPSHLLQWGLLDPVKGVKYNWATTQQQKLTKQVQKICLSEHPREKIPSHRKEDYFLALHNKNNKSIHTCTIWFGLGKSDKTSYSPHIIKLHGLVVLCFAWFCVKSYGSYSNDLHFF